MARLLISLFVACVASAQADVIWLRKDPEIVKQVGNQLQEPLKLFKGKRAGGWMHYIRGRIIDVDPSEVGSERLRVQPWARKTKGSREVEVGEPIWVRMKQVQDIEHEFDSYLDLEFMFSSRKKFASKRWKERIRLSLDPKGELGLVSGAALPPKETAEERNEVRLKGWLQFSLTEMISLPPEEVIAAPDGEESHEEMLERLRKAEQNKDLQRFRPAFHPLRQMQTPEEAVRKLLEGAALAASHEDPLRKELEERFPDPEDRSELDFDAQCRFGVGFLCALAKVPAPAALDAEGKPVPLDLDGYTRRHYREVGRAARRELIAILEQAVSGTATRYDHFRPDAVEEVESKLDKLRGKVRDRIVPYYQTLLESKGGSKRLDPRSRLEATPSELALQALRVIRNYPTWWVIQINAQDPTEGVAGRWQKLVDNPDLLPPTSESDRLIVALVHLAQRRPGIEGYPSGSGDPPLPDPRMLDGQDLRDEVQLMAQATLTGLLLPSAPDAESAEWRMPLDKLSKELASEATMSARAFRLALEPLYYSENPAVQEVVTNPLIAVVGRLDQFLFPEVLDNLFSTLNHETKPDPTASKFDVRRERAKRAFAARLIVILASQGGHDDSLPLTEARIQDFGNATVDRLLALRIARAAGEISPGERRLDDAIRKSGEGGSPLGERARAVEGLIEVERAAQEAATREELAQAREAYSAALAAQQAAPPDADAVQREALSVEVQRTQRAHEALATKLKHLLGAKR